MAEHTRGPWSIRIIAASAMIQNQVNPTYPDNIAKVFKNDPNGNTRLPWEANAALIAAAPELLAACQQLENALAFAITGHPLPNTATIIEAAQAAIVKAGGWMGIDPVDQP